MVIFTVSLSMIFAWLLFHFGSIWPSTLAHAAINAQAGFGLLLLSRADSLLGVPLGIIGLVPMIAVAIFFFQAEDGIRDLIVTGVQTCALPISSRRRHTRSDRDWSSDVCSSDLIGRAHV